MIWVSLICNLILVVIIAWQAKWIRELGKVCDEYSETCREWERMFAEKHSISETWRKMYEDARL